MPELCGSTRVRTAWAAIAASTALPPARRMSRPAADASGLAVEIICRRGISVVPAQAEITAHMPAISKVRQYPEAGYRW